MLVLAAALIAIGVALWIIGSEPNDYRAQYKVGGRPAWMGIEHPPGRCVDWSGLALSVFNRHVGPTYTRVAAMLTLAPEVCTLIHGLEEAAFDRPAIVHAAAIVYYCSALFGAPITAEAAFAAAGVVYYEEDILTAPEVASRLASENEDLFSFQAPLGVVALLSAADTVLETAPDAAPGSRLAALRPWDTTGESAHCKAE